MLYHFSASKLSLFGPVGAYTILLYVINNWCLAYLFSNRCYVFNGASKRRVRIPSSPVGCMRRYWNNWQHKWNGPALMQDTCSTWPTCCRLMVPWHISSHLSQNRELTMGLPFFLHSVLWSSGVVIFSHTKMLSSLRHECLTAPQHDIWPVLSTQFWGPGLLMHKSTAHKPTLKS